MTRRELLGLVPASLVYSAKAAEVPFDRIDTHLHVHRPVPAFTAGMEQAGWRALAVCVSRAVGDQVFDLRGMMQGTAEAARQSKGRLAWAAAFDPRPFESPDFSARTIEDLNHWFREGAIAVKIWKSIGMTIRSKSGEYLLPDHPALMRVYEAIQKADRTLVAHLAEPDGAWMPLDEKNPEINYYKNNPEWHMYGRAGVPGKKDILQARDRIVAKLPKLRLVACHIGSSESNLPAIAASLDKYPNLAVDLAARVRYFAVGDPKVAREFLTKYQDRITYATDTIVGQNEERAWASLKSRLDEEWSFFSSAGDVTYRNRQVQGLGLPDIVLKKIFHDNAKRWFPGIMK